MTFRVGQKVVCIEETDERDGLVAWPVKGGVYTIRMIDSTFADGDAGLLFVEIHNPPFPYAEGDEEPSFWIDSFRPVQTTDISIFTAMLAPTPANKKLVRA